MKRKFLLALAAVTLLAACNKDDMALLQHPYRVQGEVSPSFGLPVISNGQMNLNDLLLSFDGTFSGLITDDNTITFEYKDTIRETIPIGPIYESAMASMAHYFADGRWDTTQENLQARIRALILMAYSNRFGALVLNTSNKSELSTGYGTLYGDLAGAIMVIADLYKLQVYELCRYINRDGERIPEHIITKAPSAELRPGQKDSDSLPEYEVLDRVLHALNEEGLTEEQVLASFPDREAAARAIKLRRASSFKVMQIPPMLTVGKHPLAPAFKCI